MGDGEPLRALFSDPSAYYLWSQHWRARLARDATAPLEREEAMRRANPGFIPRDHRVEEALNAAVEHNDDASFKTLLKILSRPFDDQPEFFAYVEPAQEEQGRYITFCGT